MFGGQQVPRSKMYVGASDCKNIMLYFENFSSKGVGHGPIRKSRYPFLPSFRIGQHALECLFDIESRSRSTWQCNFVQLFLHVSSHNVRPLDTVLCGIGRSLCTISELQEDLGSTSQSEGTKNKTKGVPFRSHQILEETRLPWV